MVSAALISTLRHHTAIWTPLSVPFLSPRFISSHGPFSHKLLHDNLVHCAVQLNSKCNHCRTVAKGCNTFIHSQIAAHCFAAGSAPRRLLRVATHNLCMHWLLCLGPTSCHSACIINDYSFTHACLPSLQCKTFFICSQRPSGALSLDSW